MSDDPEQLKQTAALEESKSTNVQVLFFGAARDATGKAELQLSLKGPTTAGSALAELLKVFPDLRRFGRSLLLAVNQEYANLDLEVHDGDELAVFPPVSGGSSKNLEFGISNCEFKQLRIALDELPEKAQDREFQRISIISKFAIRNSKF